MGEKTDWGKELTEEQFFLQSSPYDDHRKKARPDFLMMVLDEVLEDDGCVDGYSVVSLQSQAEFEFFRKRQGDKGSTFLICQSFYVPHEFRGSGFCAQA